jgi:hypothetical protein
MLFFLRNSGVFSFRFSFDRAKSSKEAKLNLLRHSFRAKPLHGPVYTVKRVSGFPVPSRDVIIPGQGEFGKWGGENR